MTGEQAAEIQGAARQARTDTLALLDQRLEGEEALGSRGIVEVEEAAYGLMQAAARILRVLNDGGVSRSRPRSLAITALEQALLWEQVATGEVTL